MMRSRIRCQQGFGLPATILMMILFAVMGIVGLGLARQELRTQVQTTAREAAFYAAETGLVKGLENWSAPDTLVPPGTTWLLDAGSLPRGASYSVQAIKLDDNTTVGTLYTVRSVGRARAGQTQQVSMLVSNEPPRGLFEGALMARDSAMLTGGAIVDGFDNPPPGWWGSRCYWNGEDKAGVAVGDATEFSSGGSSTYTGDPPLVELPDTVGFFDLGDVTFEDLVASADIKLTGIDLDAKGKPIPGPRVGPSLNGDGSCDTSDPYNWGDPRNPGAPCNSWMPAIHIDGNYLIDGPDAGQGILLVEGDLVLKGGFEWYGAILVKGGLRFDGGSYVYGAVRSAYTDMGAGNAEIHYSDCAIQRALSRPELMQVHPLGQRPWFQRR